MVKRTKTLIYYLKLVDNKFIEFIEASAAAAATAAFITIVAF